MVSVYNRLWLGVGLTFVAGDMVTTVFAIEVLGAVEGNFVPSMIVEELGLWFLLPVKLAFVGVIYTMAQCLVKWDQECKRYIAWVPLSLIAMGIFITLYNLSVIFQA